jgi:DNA-binding NarL/FixJ family response regulator
MPLQTILAEDNATIREMLRAALAELANAEVIAEVETASEAIAALRRHAGAWQLAVLDLFLQEGHALDVLRAATETGPGQRIFLLTNYATPEIRRRALDAGAHGVFDKSTELDEFFAACQAIPVAPLR